MGFTVKWGKLIREKRVVTKKQSFLLQRGLSYKGVYGALFELEPDETGVLLIIWSFV